MFAAIFFEREKDVDVVNIKSVKKSDGTTPDLNSLDTNDKVMVPYKTKDLDEAGREVLRDVDYYGIVMLVHKDKSLLTTLTEKSKIDDLLRAVKEGSLQGLVNEFQKTHENSGTKRKKKQTEKMISFMNEEGTVQETMEKSPTKKKKTDGKSTSPTKKKKTQDNDPPGSPAKPTCTRTQSPSKKKKKQDNIVPPDSPAKSTRAQLKISESSACNSRTKETQKLATMEYFKKKKKMDALRGPTESSICTDNEPVAQATDAGHEGNTYLPCLTVPQMSIPTCMPQSPLMHLGEQTSQYTDLDTGKLVNTDAISQGFKALHDTVYIPEEEYTGCQECNKNQKMLANLQDEINDLKNENTYLQDQLNYKRGNAEPSILMEMKNLIAKYEKNNQNMSTKINIAQYGGPSMDLGDNASTCGTSYSADFTDVDSEMSFQSSSLHCSSTPNRKTQKAKVIISTAERDSARVDKVETVSNFQEFLTPGSNKIQLVEGHSLYVDAAKLQAMKNRAKKNPSRLVRELVSYFFTEDYLNDHSATGTKSNKKGLPVEIMDPIRIFMSNNYKFETTNLVVNRKCLDMKRKKQNS